MYTDIFVYIDTNNTYVAETKMNEGSHMCEVSPDLGKL